MCLPVAGLAAVSTAATVAGAAISAVGAINSANANAAQSQYQAAVARQNQDFANQQAQYEIQKGNIEEQKSRQQTAQMIGAARSRAGAGNIDVNSGSPLSLQTDTASLGEMDALTIRNNAARNAYGYQVQGLSYGSSAQLDESAAANDRTAGWFNAGSSILGGAGQLSSKWAQFKTTGVW